MTIQGYAAGRAGECGSIRKDWIYFPPVGLDVCLWRAGAKLLHKAPATSKLKTTPGQGLGCRAPSDRKLVVSVSEFRRDVSPGCSCSGCVLLWTDWRTRASEIFLFFPHSSNSCQTLAGSPAFCSAVLGEGLWTRDTPDPSLAAQRLMLCNQNAHSPEPDKDSFTHMSP